MAVCWAVVNVMPDEVTLAVASAAEATASVTSSGITLTTAQQTAIENAFTLPSVGSNTNNGTVNWAYTIAEGDLDFLGANETVTAVFTITVTDDANAIATQNVTITITGANDAPDIQVVDVAGTIQEGGTLSENGSITFTDVDLTDRPTAAEATASVTSSGITLTTAQQTAIENAFTLPSVGSNTNNGTVNWAYTIAEGDLNFLGADETITAVFTITVTDDANAIATQNVTITITGANDAPDIQVVDVAGTIQEGGTLSENGSITFTDVDLTDRPTAAEATASVTSSGITLTTAQQTAIENAFTLPSVGSNTNNGTVNWAYTIAEGDLNFLGADETITAVFTITVTDDANAIATQNVTITITGANDAPDIQVVDVAGTIQEGGTLSENGSITFTDVDLTDRPTAAEATASVTFCRGITLTTAQQTAIETAVPLLSQVTSAMV